MNAPRLTVIPDILEEHFEEIEYLWPQRQDALTSRDYFPDEFRELEDRLQAHLQGLAVGGEFTVTLGTSRLLEDPDYEIAFAAALGLLAPDLPAGREQMLTALMEARGPALTGLRDALGRRPRAVAADTLLELLRSAPTPLAGAAGWLLAARGQLPPEEEPRLAPLAEDADPDLRRAYWQTLALADDGHDPWPHRAHRPYRSAFEDDAAGVRDQALFTAAWTREDWVRPLSRQLAQRDPLHYPGAATLLAVLGDRADHPLLLRLGRDGALGRQRFALLADWGHPDGVPILLETMEADDPREAEAAGAAFTRITGEEVAGGERLLVTDEDGDELEREFPDEVFPPDAAKARAIWQDLAPRLGDSRRLCRGQDLSQGVAPQRLEALDMAARRDCFLRARRAGNWTAPLAGVLLEGGPVPRD